MPSLRVLGRFFIFVFTLVIAYGLAGQFRSLSTLAATLKAVKAQSQTQDIDLTIIYSLGRKNLDSVSNFVVDESDNVYLCVTPLKTGFASPGLVIIKLNSRGELIYQKIIAQVGISSSPQITIDKGGNAYIGGATRDTNFPVTSGALFGSLRGGDDGFVLKLDSGGSIVYSTYFGGLNDDFINDIAIDNAGGVYVTGATNSTSSFPILNGPQVIHGDGGRVNDAFVAKIDVTAGKLVYSTFLGGENDDIGRAIKVNSFGNAFVAGETHSASFPFVRGVTRNFGFGDGFITEMSPTGSSFVYSTTIFASDPDSINDIAVDDSDNVYACGQTRSADFPLINAFQVEKRGFSDAFVFAINIRRNEFLFSTYLGGSGTESANGLFLDNLGNIYITGRTSYPDFPRLKPLRETPGGELINDDAFFTKFSAGGSLIYSSLLGGSMDDSASSIAANGDKIWVAGRTLSSDFPVTPSNLVPINKLSGTGFLTKISETGPLACVVTCNTNVPQTAEINKPVDFNALLKASEGCQGSVSSLWDFGDGFVSASPDNTHVYTRTGIYNWKLNVRLNGQIVCSSSGQITITLLPCFVPSVVMETRDQAVLVNQKVTLTANANGTESLNFRWFRKTGLEIAFLGRSDLPSFDIATNTISFSEYYVSVNNQCGVTTSASVKIAVTDRYPVIFVPGIGGSVLKDTGPGFTEYWPGPTTSDDTKQKALSLDPNAPKTEIIATDVVRSVLGNDIYGSFLDFMKNSGYRENKSSEQNPTLYLLPYDWRLSSRNNIKTVETAIRSIRQRYPGAPVNVITHSMGGLLIRSYILAHPNDNGVDKFISIASPWLGTPKGISVMFDGQFIDGFLGSLEQKLLISQDSLKKLVKFWPGIHELAPSKAYFDLGGKPLIFKGFDQNGNKIKKNGTVMLGYDDTMSYLNAVIGGGIRDNNFNFHSSAQDDERGNGFGVDYYHIVGKTNANKTIMSVVLTGQKSKKVIGYTMTTEQGQGDGTVTLISAQRKGMNQNENSDHLFTVDEMGGSFDHTSLVKQSDVRKILSKLLNITVISAQFAQKEQQ